jgi:hypothetical protein
MSASAPGHYEFIAFRDGSVNSSRSVDPSDPEYMMEAFTQLRDNAEPGDVICLVEHQAAFCMCPDDLGYRDGCVQLTETTVS